MPLDGAALLALPPWLRARRELLPLVYGVLAEAGLLERLPADERASGRRAYLGTLSRNTRILARTREVLDAAEAAGLTLLPYKGALFAEALYGDPGRRPMVDVDLLVLPGEVAPACELLGGLGFRRNYAGQVRFTPAHAHDVSFTDERDPELTIELHYRLYHELSADARLEPLFARAVELPFLGRVRRVPAFGDHLMAVAVHAATHAFGDQPLWPFDLVLLAERAGGTGEALREAERRRSGAAFRAALAVAARVCPALEAPPLSRGDRLRARLLRALLGPEPLAAPPARLRSLGARAVLTERPRDAAREVARKLRLRAVEATLAARSFRTAGRRSGT